MTQSATASEGQSPLGRRAAEWTLELVAIPSVTGTADEAAFAEKLRDRLAGLPAFAGHPGAVWTVPVEGDRLGRDCVAALLRGEGPRTVILTGHYDTVHTEDYGDLAALATRPTELKEALLARLAGAGSTAAEQLALGDLRSGAFLPGRGLLDMKSGLAAGLAVIEAAAAEPDRIGNILFLAVPDEEANSAGARAAAAALPEIAERFGLSLDAAINLDSLVDAGEGEIGRSVALGTIGKLLPSALIIGRAVHASNSLQGVNAGLLAAEIVAGMEWAAALTERSGDEQAPPPTLLGMKDNRIAYDVTTPERIWAYWNVMTHRQGPAEVLGRFRDICREAGRRVLGGLAGKAAALQLDPGLPADIPVFTFAELRAEVLGENPGVETGLASLARDVARRGLDLPEQCRILTEHLWTASRRTGPAVVIGFASMPYPPTRLRGAAGAQLERAVRDAAGEVAQVLGSSIGIMRYFPGISDMSHLGQVDPDAVPAVAANTPAWGFGIPVPSNERSPGVPIVNAGPWGRDYHTPLERLHTGYAFEVLPQLLQAMVQRILRNA